MKNGEVVKASGLIFAMLDEIGKKLNFTYVVIPPDDGRYGVNKADEQKLNGMVGMLERNEVRVFLIAYRS